MDDDVTRSDYGRRPWERRTLCREIAVGEMTKAAIGRKYGITGQAVTQFAKRHATEIDAIKADLDNEFAGLWVAQKAARIAAYQADLEMALESDKADHHEWVKARTAILHTVAEELGQLPARGGIITVAVTHILEGVDVENLK